MQETYVLAPREGFAVPGTLKNGSDSVGVMATRAALAQHLLALPNVRCVVLDGVRSSRRWDVDWVQVQGTAAVYAYLNISEKENVRRLLERRKANGHVEKQLPEKTYRNMLNFRRRAAGVFAAARQFFPSATFVELTEADDPATAARKVRKAVARCV